MKKNLLLRKYVSDLHLLFKKINTQHIAGKHLYLVIWRYVLDQTNTITLKVVEINFKIQTHDGFTNSSQRKCKQNI